MRTFPEIRSARRLIVLGAAWLAACGTSSPSVAVRTPAAPIAPDFDKVTVVVVQPESRLRAVSIVDGRGQLVGVLDDWSHTVIRLPEGPTVLYAVVGNHPETADRIEGTLVAGRVYYALIGAREDGLTFVTLSARSPWNRWKHRDAYVTDTPRLAMNPEKVGRAAAELGDPQAIMRAADDRVSKLDTASAAERSFQESDGF
jgi:hypothetical protein